MNIRLTQIDGALPNIALMRLAKFYRNQGHYVHLTRALIRQKSEPEYDKEFASTLFTFSKPKVDKFKVQFPNCVIGGTGSGNPMTIEALIGDFYDLDYSDYPDVEYSIGFLQRGCRLSCKFCVVPTKEGKNRNFQSVYDIWRGEGHPKKLHILDNDFFGNPEWEKRALEIVDGKFKICLSQGINVRLINPVAADALATMQYRDTKFSRRRLYTAWDNIGDEKIFFKGVDMLEAAGIPPKHLMAYMLIGYDKSETWGRIFHRFNAMTARGIMPYPMVFNNANKELKAFQRWAVTGLYRAVPWEEYKYKPDNWELYDLL